MLCSMRISRPGNAPRVVLLKPLPHVMRRFLVYVDGRLVAQMPPPNYSTSSTDINSLEIDGGDPLEVRPASCMYSFPCWSRNTAHQ